LRAVDVCEKEVRKNGRRRTAIRRPSNGQLDRATDELTMQQRKTQRIHCIYVTSSLTLQKVILSMLHNSAVILQIEDLYVP